MAAQQSLTARASALLADFAASKKALAAPTGAHAARVHGAVIFDKTVKVDDSRYRSKQNWDRTLRFFRKVYSDKPGMVLHSVPTPPRVKAVHIENTNSGASWEGINIYETGGKVFIYVIAAQDAQGAKSKAKKPKKPKRGKKSKKASRQR